MVAIFVEEFYQRKVIIPISFEINHRSPQHVFKSLDGALHLSIQLRVDSCANLNLGTKPALKRSPKVRGELGTSIQNNQQGGPIQLHSLNIQFSILLR